MANNKSYRDELIGEIRRLAQTQGLNNVFTNFLEISATSIAMEMDHANADKRRKRYEEMTSGMEPNILDSYARMLVLLILETQKHSEDPCDILGSIYHELRLNNEWNGQFFTPDNICRMMAEMINPVDERPETEYPITINEPACGSGTMVIGVLWAMQRAGFDFQHKSFFIAQDIDIRCVWMAYIQLSLYGIPAVVVHGNSLTMAEWSRWHTPLSPLPFLKQKNSEEKS